jgi:flagellar motor switch protein FliG
VLKSFPSAAQRGDGAHRHARRHPAQALKDLNEVLSKVLAGGDRMKKASLGGVKTAAEIINMMGSRVETAVLDYIREADGELAQKIMDNMFTFDDLDQDRRQGHPVAAQGSAERVAGHGAQGRHAGTAREGVPNMSSRAAETLREDLESRGPVRCPRSRPSRRKC